MRPLVLSYAGVLPAFRAPPRHAGLGSAVLGRVTLGRNAWLGALSVVRADGHIVRVGDDCRIGARSTLHITEGILPCILGDRVSVGENVCVHACTLGNDIVVGNEAVILDGAVVADDVVFEAGAVVFPNKQVAGGFLYAGSPATAVRPLYEGEVARRRSSLEGPERLAPTAAVATHAASLNVHPSVFMAASASVRGRLSAAEGASIWFSTCCDAGAGHISIGARSNVQDNTLMRVSTELGITVGPDSTVGHNAILGDCRIGAESLIGIGSRVASGTMIGDRVLLAAGARTQPGQELESGWLYSGRPARKRAALDANKLALIRLIVHQYCTYAREFKVRQEERAGECR